MLRAKVNSGPNHLSAANRRFRFPSDALSCFERFVCAGHLLTAPVAERDQLHQLHQLHQTAVAARHIFWHC